MFADLEYICSVPFPVLVIITCPIGQIMGWDSHRGMAWDGLLAVVDELSRHWDFPTKQVIALEQYVSQRI